VPALVLLSVGSALLALFLILAARASGMWGVFPLDDTYIHLRLTDNWLRGRGFVINPGEVTVPESSALWGVLLCAAGGAARGLGVSLTTTAMALSALFYLALGPLAFLIVRHATRDTLLATFGAVSVLLTGRLIWSGASGMEITLAAALGLLLLWLDMRRPERRFSCLVALIGGLATLARPEMALLVTCIAVIRARGIRNPGAWAEAAVAAAVFGLYPLALLLATGDALPPSLGARRAIIDETRGDFLVRLGTMLFLRENTLLHLLFPIAVVTAIWSRRWSPLWLWPAAHFLAAFALFHCTYHHARYLIPIVPGIICAVVIALPDFAKRFSSAPMRPARAVAAALCVAAAIGLPEWSSLYARNVRNMHDQQLQIVEWINANTDPDDLLAVNDIGAYTFFTDRRVVDLGGLATPEIVPILEMGGIWEGRSDAALADVILARECNWAIFFPRWFPELAERDDILARVATFRISDNTICGDSEVIACRVIGAGG
jgi:hypothetical protein